MKHTIWVLLFLGVATGLYCQAVVTASGNVQLNSATGTRLVLQGGISFTGTATFIDNGRVDVVTHPLSVASNWNDATASGAYDATSTGHVYFSATGIQTITGSTRFFNVTVDGAAGISLGSDIEVRNQLNLNGGLFTTGIHKVYVSNGATNAIQSSNSFASFINGRLERLANMGGTDYLFPIGKVVGAVTFYSPVRFNKINANTTRYTGEYFRAVPFDRTNRLFPPIDHVSFVEYWELTSTAAAGSADDDAALSLSWRLNSVVSPDPVEREDLMIAHYRNNFGFRWEPETNTAIVNNVSGTPSFGSITSNITVLSFTHAERRFTLASRSANNALPLSKWDWAVKSAEQNVRINWQAENDVQIAAYIVERGSSRFIFTPIGTISSNKNTGTSNYQLTDTRPLAGRNYYRIQMKTLSGETLYSTIKTVEHHLFHKVRLSPNPARDYVTIQLAELPKPGSELQIIGGDGKMVFFTQQVQRSMQLSLQHLAPGYYILKLTTPDGVTSYPFIKGDH